MNPLFFIVEDGRQKGPFTLEEMRAQIITTETLVWTEGFASWTKAGHVAILKDITVVAPPPIPGSEDKNTPPDPPQQTPPPPATPAGDNNGYFGYALARRRDRLFATLIEWLLLFIFWRFILGIHDDDGSVYTVWNFVVQALYGLIYGAILYPFFSGNLGHKIMGLKVISSEDGADQNKAAAGALRESVKAVMGFLIIPIIWLLWDRQNQNLYDKVVRTYVVYKIK